MSWQATTHLAGAAPAGAGEQGLELGDELVDLVLGDVATRRRPSARHPRSLARRRRASPLPPPDAGTNDEHSAQDRAKLEDEAKLPRVCASTGALLGSLARCVLRGNWERRCVGYPRALDWGSLCKLKLEDAGVSN